MAHPTDLLVARLIGTATRHAHDDSPVEVAVAELHTITRDLVVLGRAAGSVLGGWQTDGATRPFAPRIGRLLEAAGADQDARDAEAAVVVERLRARRPKWKTEG